MRRSSGAHPRLAALLTDGFVAIDCETTGMDPRSDRIVSLAAVRFGPGGREDAVFDTLVDPGRPIPAASVAIHGIRDDLVRGAPGLDAVLPAFRAFVGPAIPIAHMGAFDLAFLQRPLRRGGLATLERMLDTAVLATRLLGPLPDQSLEVVCAALGLGVSGRHTATGDARLAAAVFARLLPLLEARGARTLEAALHWGDVMRAP